MGRIWLRGWWFIFRGDGDRQLGQQVAPLLLCYVLMPGQLPQLVMLLCPQSDSHALLDPALPYPLKNAIICICQSRKLRNREWKWSKIKVYSLRKYSEDFSIWCFVQHDMRFGLSDPCVWMTGASYPYSIRAVSAQHAGVCPLASVSPTPTPAPLLALAGQELPLLSRSVWGRQLC